MAQTTTAKVIVSGKSLNGDQITLQFQADYQDGRNKEWSKYTPSLNFQMVVKPEVAGNFELGDRFLVTFTPEAADAAPVGE